MAFLNWMRHKRDTTQLCNCFSKAVAAASQVWRFSKTLHSLEAAHRYESDCPKAKQIYAPFRHFLVFSAFGHQVMGLIVFHTVNQKRIWDWKKQKQNHTFGYMCLLRVTLYLKKKVQRAAALNQMIKTTCCASGLGTMCWDLDRQHVAGSLHLWQQSRCAGKLVMPGTEVAAPATSYLATVQLTALNMLYILLTTAPPGVWRQYWVWQGLRLIHAGNLMFIRY